MLNIFTSKRLAYQFPLKQEGAIKVRFNGPWWWFENQAACGVSTADLKHRAVGRQKEKKKKRSEHFQHLECLFSLYGFRIEAATAVLSKCFKNSACGGC